MSSEGFSRHLRARRRLPDWKRPRPSSAYSMHTRPSCDSAPGERRCLSCSTTSTGLTSPRYNCSNISRESCRDSESSWSAHIATPIFRGLTHSQRPLLRSTARGYSNESCSVAFPGPRSRTTSEEPPVRSHLPNWCSASLKRQEGNPFFLSEVVNLMAQPVRRRELGCAGVGGGANVRRLLARACN